MNRHQLVTFRCLLTVLAIAACKPSESAGVKTDNFGHDAPPLFDSGEMSQAQAGALASDACDPSKEPLPDFCTQPVLFVGDGFYEGKNLQTLFGAVKKLDWPPLPRRYFKAWSETGKSTSFEFRAGSWNNNYKNGFKYSYVVRSEFNLLGTSQITATSGAINQALTVNKPGEVLNYPNVTPDNRLVGFCQYSTVIDVNQHQSVNGALQFSFFGGASISIASNQTKGVGSSVTTNFFLPNPDVPIRDYLTLVCQGLFESSQHKVPVKDGGPETTLSIRQVMEDEMGRQLRELFYFNDNECDPPEAGKLVEGGDSSSIGSPAELVPGKRGEKGDKTCDLWLGQYTEKGPGWSWLPDKKYAYLDRAVPRCLPDYQTGNRFSCRFVGTQNPEKAAYEGKGGHPCPMYENPATGEKRSFYPQAPDDSWKKITADSQYAPEAACDGFTGHRCVLETAGGMLNSAKAYCQKTNTIETKVDPSAAALSPVAPSSVAPSSVAPSTNFDEHYDAFGGTFAPESSPGAATAPAPPL